MDWISMPWHLGNMCANVRSCMGHGIGHDMCASVRPCLGHGIDIHMCTSVRPCLRHGISVETRASVRTCLGLASASICSYSKLMRYEYSYVALMCCQASIGHQGTLETSTTLSPEAFGWYK
ncbi:Hemicentin-1 [Gossypium arboreum]|uniref:Hemicentin-1 n=1 Tax=Gossypium arboreum TaxID=29729 RepID=A0A0B0NBJ9_GOSAR|nr:Hemicentin-1 [Gossypium arboreum]